MSSALRARSSRQSHVAKKLYAPTSGHTLADARALVAEMDVHETATGTTYLLRRAASGAVVQRILVPPDALPLLGWLRGDA